MRDATLSLNEQHFVMLIGDDHLFCRSGDKISDDAVEWQPIALDHDSRLPGGDEFRINPATL
jgi:hypothetical protein